MLGLTAVVLGGTDGRDFRCDGWLDGFRCEGWARLQVGWIGVIMSGRPGYVFDSKGQVGVQV